MVVLGKVAGVSFISPFHLALVRLQLAHDDLEQRGLADPVRPHDHQAVTPPDLEIHTMEHFLVAKCLFQAGDPEYIPPAFAALHEAELGIAP